MDSEAGSGIFLFFFFVISLGAALAFAIPLFQAAKKRVRHFGEAPWGLPPAGWGAMGFFLTWVGVALFFVAKGKQGELRHSRV